MKKTLFALLTASLALSAVPFTPPLPEGAQRDWDLQNAWKRQSATQTEYCINGLWDFRSAPELKPSQNLKLLYQLKTEDLKRLYQIMEGQKGVDIKYSLDPKEHTTGKASLRLDVNAAPGTNLFQGMFLMKDLPREIPGLLCFDIKSEAEGSPFNAELQDSRSWKIFTTRSASIPTKSNWHTVKIPILIPKSASSYKFILPRNQSGNLKGTIWLDNVRFYQQTFPSAVQATVPHDQNWGCALVPGGWVQDPPKATAAAVFWHPQDKGRDKQLPFGWFRRAIQIPEAWNGKRITIRFDRIASSATIYCNKQLAGNLPFFGGEVDVTRFAKPGTTLELAVLVLAQPPMEAQPSYTGRSRTSFSHAGIFGDVFLRVSDRVPCQVARPRSVTTTADRTLAVHAALASPAPADTSRPPTPTRQSTPQPHTSPTPHPRTIEDFPPPTRPS